jgi:ATP-binding cassette subfamily C protein
MGEEIAKEELYKALEVAQLSDFIKNLKDGLNTQVGKFGVKLSGGQRQRLSIARMVLSNPKVVIFDESTSALDVHTEATLFKALKVFLEDKTVIIIAHRLSTINNADYIYMLEDGKITEEGTDLDLQKKDGSFSTFIQENSL